MNLHDPILDREAGTWVMFGEGDYLNCQIHETHPNLNCRPGPPDWMVEAAKPCETCDGAGVAAWEDAGPGGPLDEPEPITCPDCDNGRQQHTITVLCETCGGSGKPGMFCNGTPFPSQAQRCTGRITVPELAVVEWGALVVVDEMSMRTVGWPLIAVVYGQGRVWIREETPDGVATTVLTLPPNIDPATLVGQYALGGRLVKP